MMLIQRLKNIIFRDVLLYVVFFTGAVVLAIEVMAVRILSPFFGNTIVSFSSIISVILAALSIGYWYGGRLADRKQSKEFFYKLVALSGGLTVLSQVLSFGVLSITSKYASIMLGPLIAAFVLFFLPAFVFGLFSPFVIALRSRALPEIGVGQISGEVFFFSTLGSIFGSLFSGFFLIPVVGVTTSMLAMGTFLMVIGALGSTAKKKVKFLRAGVALLCVGYGSVVGYGIVEDFSLGFHKDYILDMKDGLYAKIFVIERAHGDTKERLLMLDRSRSSGITYPEGVLTFKYAHFYKLLPVLRPEMNNVLILGAAAGTMAKALHENYPQTQIDLVDIEPALFEIAHEYFLLPESPKIHNHIGDGRVYLKNNEQRYDAIFSDMYSSLYFFPWHTATVEFYELLYDRLEDGGVYVSNHIGYFDFSEPSLIGGVANTMYQVFDEVYVMPVASTEPKVVQNVIFVGTKGEVELTAEMLTTHDDLRLQFAGKYLIHVDEGLLNTQELFTDTHSSLDVYALELIKDNL